MSNKNFLQGLFYGLAYSQSVTSEYISHQILIVFEDGSQLLFAINRGISHEYGNMVAMMTNKLSCNLFDIALNWITKNQMILIESLGYDFEYGEIRITFEELINIINLLGTIDVEKTNQKWLSVHKRKYQKH